MRGVVEIPSYLLLQPTTLCNLDCAYCYLPHRAVDRRMSVPVAAAVAETVNDWATRVDRFSVVWHGGEPLAAGREHLASLMAPFTGVEHHIQTNGTLIDDEWCGFFRDHRIEVGLSLDGPATRTALRVDRAGRPAYERIMRGVAALRAHDIRFAVICVVSEPTPELARELYDFFGQLGCYWLGVNIEEREGVNRRDNHRTDAAVRGFWSALTAAWVADPRFELREVEWSLHYLAAAVRGEADSVLPRRRDPVPTVAYDGRVVLFSPELAGFDAAGGHRDFALGNVRQTPLAEIVAAANRPTGWVAEYLTGVERCRRGCAYFGFCGGAHASNRYFELGRFDVTETEHCRNTKIRLLEGVLDAARDT
ncbi:radical SAM protein [Natronosporangium hydrolyticum]|uniref:Radical SAM protein n=1 Tax=Natronosporangium hydrolyticum TaxID=2811111 RepID=A0A895YNQ5_9ACTN|nr:cyclophane-forming radical SAM peptide maturase AmcB [Natronosporangium hydrolyticum]QSB17565.1 radical SAM protein [Natronosporangium hydrolyticum]